MKFRTALSAANSLQRMWRARHKERYFTIDQDRCNILISTGLLKDVSFAATRADDVPAWMAKEIAPASEVASDLKDDVGNWWLNIACAHRDGMVESSQERPSKSRYGTAILPLLTGKEEISDDGVVKYIREGRQRDMHISLISQVGSETGILRGYRLKSVYAPSARIRYDGLYRIRQWGQKLDVNTNIYRLEVTLDRVKGQKSMDDVKKTPKPSQIDDWHLYEKLESEWIKQRQGDTAFMDWRMRREEEKVDREQWRRTREFRSSLSAPRKKWKSGTSKLLTTSKVLGRMPRIRSKSPEPVARRPTVVFNEGIPETPL
ncbi:PUA-like domain-containing protein [Pleurostoma richardsiae]|uniref:PUA-like domain-containing protein n=1 Tax=Pleurostoma richardsiae TaxID=41990 RepID=A0AA38RP63_9PEZI|nr:PUA-like domain-containing protein [Pleurostoma richardsiae]